jgi:hypothetical protein
MNKLLRLGRSIPPGQIRIGIVAESPNLEVWKIGVIDALLSDSAIKVEALFTVPRAPHSPPWLYARCFDWSSSVAGSERLAEYPSHFPLRTELPPCNGTWLSPEIHRQIAKCNLDVLLCLTSLPGNYSGTAKFGAWWFSFGDPCEQKFHPAFFAEALRGDLVSELWLLVCLGKSERTVVIDRYSASTQQGWYFTQNALEPLKVAAPLLLRRLLDLLEFGPGHFHERIADSEIVKCAGLPAIYSSAGKIGAYLLRQMFRSLKFRLEDRGRRMHWFLAARSNVERVYPNADTLVLSDFREVSKSRGSQEADPFLITWQGRTFLFYEEIPHSTGRGCISCREIRADLSVSESVRVIEQPYHMSYPFLVPIGDEIYMLPETSTNRTLELYRATNFPFEWALDKVLLRDVAVVDTTPFRIDATWYFFTTDADTGEALLFYSDRFDGEWHYHPRNPICSDIRRARGAGCLFYRGGKLIRPAQDCSVRYGYAIALNEITALTEAEYAEKLVETLLPNWADGLLGTHTINSTPSIQVVDGLRMRY